MDWNEVGENKREYNSERRRKLILINLSIKKSMLKIRGNITPRGDGNMIAGVELLRRKDRKNKREYNSERRRKQSSELIL